MGACSRDLAPGDDLEAAAAEHDDHRGEDQTEKPKATFKKCRPPKAYKHLKAGRHTFSVRAKGPGGVDPTPAKKKFKIHP